MSGYYRIKNWREFQHYTDRAPPWIKLHRDLLTSRTWVSASDSERVLAVACMLVAAGTDNKIPDDPAYMARVAYLNGEPRLSRLVDLDFLEFVGESGEVQAPASATLASASTPQAAASKMYSEERREDKTEERRGEERRKRATRLPPDWQPDLDQVAYAKSLGLDAGKVTDRFRDYWHGVAGQKGVKADWAATWRNWCRSAAERGECKPTTPTGAPETVSRGESREQWLARMKREEEQANAAA